MKIHFCQQQLPPIFFNQEQIAQWQSYGNSIHPKKRKILISDGPRKYRHMSIVKVVGRRRLYYLKIHNSDDPTSIRTYQVSGPENFNVGFL